MPDLPLVENGCHAASACLQDLSFLFRVFLLASHFSSRFSTPRIIYPCPAPLHPATGFPAACVFQPAARGLSGARMHPLLLHPSSTSSGAPQALRDPFALRRLPCRLTPPCAPFVSCLHLRLHQQAARDGPFCPADTRHIRQACGWASHATNSMPLAPPFAPAIHALVPMHVATACEAVHVPECSMSCVARAQGFTPRESREQAVHSARR